MIEMEYSGPHITDDDVEKVEREFDIKFPGEYRSFLLEVNGGRPASSNVNFPIREGGSTLHFLYGIGMQGDLKVMDLENNVRSGRDGWLYIPETLVPVGDDSGGDFICLGVAGNEAGRVYYRDSERVPDEPPRRPWTKMKGYVRIADSFSEFLAMLAPRAP